MRYIFLAPNTMPGIINTQKTSIDLFKKLVNNMNTNNLKKVQ